MRRGFFEYLWGLIPDRCEMPECTRMGVYGNENVVDGKLMCDYCHAVWMDEQKKRLHWRDRAKKFMR